MFFFTTNQIWIWDENPQCHYGKYLGIVKHCTCGGFDPVMTQSSSKNSWDPWFWGVPHSEKPPIVGKSWIVVIQRGWKYWGKMKQDIRHVMISPTWT
jgi:hypothetical protein